MRSPVPALAVLVLLTGCGGGAGGGAAASCVGPQVTLEPDRAAVGDAVSVGVEWLREGCNDYSGADEEHALTDVPVSFVQGGRTVSLGTVSGTGDRFSGQLATAVPAGGVPGPAAVTVGAYGGADLTVLP
jgi:hypothetical protein